MVIQTIYRAKNHSHCVIVIFLFSMGILPVVEYMYNALYDSLEHGGVATSDLVG